MKKKVVSVLLCVAMTATMLLGCSAGSEKSDSKKSSKSESGGTTEMKVDGDATTINVCRRASGASGTCMEKSGRE